MEKIYGKYYSPEEFDESKLPDNTNYLKEFNVLSFESKEAKSYKEAFLSRLENGEELWVMGFLGTTHNSGISLIKATKKYGIEVIGNYEEERFNGTKHFAGYPANCVPEIKKCLASFNKSPNDIFCFTYAWDVVEEERCSQKLILQHKNLIKNKYYKHITDAAAPTSDLNDSFATQDHFFRHSPSLVKVFEKLQQDLGIKEKRPCFPMLHHENHAYFSYGVSPFASQELLKENTMIACLDGGGDLSSITLFTTSSGEIKLWKRYSRANSLGVFYMLCSSFLGGWTALSSEGRYMGAAAWGNHDRLTNPYYKRLRQFFIFEEQGIVHFNSAMAENNYLALQKIMGDFIDINDLWNPDKVLNVNDVAHPQITQERVDKASAVQMVFEDALFHIIDYFIRETGFNKLVLCGGTALNCVASMRLLQLFNENYYQRYFQNKTQLQLWVPPIPSDQGVVIGAPYQFAMRCGASPQGLLPTPFLCGMPPTKKEITHALEKCNHIHYEEINFNDKLNALQDLADWMAWIVAHDGVIGIFQGAAETGPRALGHRSFFSNPRNTDILEVLNSRVKLREKIRPLAPMVTPEQAHKWFVLEEGAGLADYNAYDYMVLTAKAKPEAYRYIPAVIHEDGTCRIQIVRKENNPLIHFYLKSLGKYLGVEVSINTSLNVGSPIVQTPEQALEIFKRAKGLDTLFMVANDGSAYTVWAKEGVQEYPSRIKELKESYKLSDRGAFVYQDPYSDPIFILNKKREILELVQNGQISVSEAKNRILTLIKKNTAVKGTHTANEKRTHEEIAVIGMSGRFPEADNIEAYWENLKKAKQSIKNAPQDRGWVIDDYLSETLQSPGKTYSSKGAFLDNIKRFDSLFFGIPPSDAEYMDPSERIFLEESWKALENSGYNPKDLSSKNWGVFACAKGDYSCRVASVLPEYFVATDSYAASRLSYTLNLKGPAIALDTACSSTLSAIAYACDSLVLGNCEGAIVGGGGIYTTPNMLIMSSQSMLFSPTNQCLSFDEKADGTVLGEAIGVVILKPLSIAEADGDPIYGTIKAWGTNQDGKTNGITAPNGNSQRDLQSKVYDKFQINPESIDYIEAHGTGTKLGDPVEVMALKESFEKYTVKKEFCYLGSVKSNIGHCFFGAGVAAVIKVMMSLKNECIAPLAGFNTSNPMVPIADSPFVFNKKPIDWKPKLNSSRLAGVNSFGASGINVHLVLSDYKEEGRGMIESPDIHYSFPFWARTIQELKNTIHRFINFLTSESINVLDLSYTLINTRAKQKFCHEFVAANIVDLIEQMKAWVPLKNSKLANPKLLESSKGGRRIHLPGYQFGGEDHWIEYDIINLKNRKYFLKEFVLKESEWVPCDRLISTSLSGWNVIDLVVDKIHSTQIDYYKSYRESFEKVFQKCKEKIKLSEPNEKLFFKVQVLKDLKFARSLYAFFKSLNKEYENICFHINLTDAVVPQELNAICVNKLVRTHHSIDEYLEWKDVDFKPSARVPFSEITLITGGLGGLGKIFAKHILESNSKSRVVLTGRGDLKGRLEKEYFAYKQSLEKKLQSRLDYEKLDVCSYKELYDLVESIQGKKSIIHCAGMIKDAFLINKKFESFEKVLRPKVLGAYNINRLSKKLEIEQIVYCSSGCAVTGNASQTDYAAANAFMDQLADEAKRSGSEKVSETKIYSINWPLWSQGGMKPNSDSLRELKKYTGMVPLKTEPGVKILNQLDRFNSGSFIVLPGDVEKIQSWFVRDLSFVKANSIAEFSKVDTILSNKELSKQLISTLHELFAEVLKIAHKELDDDIEFEEYGIDSIHVNRLNKELKEQFLNAGVGFEDIDIPIASYFQYRTIKSMGDYLLDNFTKACVQLCGKNNSNNSVGSFSNSNGLKEFTDLNQKFKPIAIIGLVGQYPLAENVDEFWKNLAEGKDCITEVPKDRWEQNEFYNEDPIKAVTKGQSYCKRGGFLTSYNEFDPLFFKLSPLEALSVDPQERIFLQTCWHVIEDAGYNKETLKTKFNNFIGVFVGITKTGYGYRNNSEKYEAVIDDEIDHTAPLIPSTSFASVANRISWIMNFSGPSMPIDTMCSSSLTAIHEACKHLMDGQCEMAIAGGVNLYLHPINYTSLCASQMLSVDGKCKSFGAGANGFVPGEGVGAVLLKDYQKANQDEDFIYGVIKGTAINHDGRTNGYTVPNPEAQKELIETAVRAANINPDSISCFEAHGTGTELGDPIEFEGIIQGLSLRTRKSNKLALGSVKSNIGHLEAAAGIAGVSKILMQFKHKKLVPSLHSSILNPNISLGKLPIVIPQELQPWNSVEDNLTACISSFGAGGANAHVILENEFPVVNKNISKEDKLLLLSGVDWEDVKDKLVDICNFINRKGFEEKDLGSLSYTLCVGRDHFECRLGCIFNDFIGFSKMVEGLCKSQINLNEQVTGARVSEKLNSGTISKSSDIRKVLHDWLKGESVSDAYSDYLKKKGISFTRIPLPLYPFKKGKYWIREKVASENQGSVQKNKPVDWVFRWQFAKNLVQSPIHKIEDKPLKILVIHFWKHHELPKYLIQSLGDRGKVEWVTPREDLEFEQQGFEYDELYLIGNNIPHNVKEYHKKKSVDALNFEEINSFKLLKKLHQLEYYKKELSVYFIQFDKSISGAGFTGIAYSVAQSNHNWKVYNLEVDSTTIYNSALCKSFIKNIECTPRNERGVFIKVIEGSCFTRKFYPNKIVNTNQNLPSFKNSGVYVIVGGAGTVGTILSHYLIDTYSANVVWVGRKAKDNESIQERLLGFNGKSREPVYLQGDVCVELELKEIKTQVLNRFGEIHGVIFSGIVFWFNSAMHSIDEKEFIEVLQVKSKGSMNCLDVFGNSVTDFICLFSSAQSFSFSGASGLPAYASGITYADKVCGLLKSQYSTPIGIVNWGFWKASQIGSSANQNFSTLENNDACRSLDHFIGALRNRQLDQCLIMNASIPVQALMNLGTQKSLYRMSDAACVNSIYSDFNRQNKNTMEKIAEKVNTIPFGELHSWLVRLTLYYFKSEGLLPDNNFQRNDLLNCFQKLTSKNFIVNKYRKWWMECMETLLASDFYSVSDGIYTELNHERINKNILRGWSDYKNVNANNNELSAQINLVSNCFENFKPIIAGFKPPTDVLFRQSSMENVEGIYKENKIGDFFNNTLVYGLESFIKQNLNTNVNKKIKIIEVGSGTGGTSASVLKMLDQYSENVEFYYTDLSKAFLHHGEDNYSQSRNYFKTKIWNVEQDPKSQGFDESTFDVVIAANVLHATTDIQRTLGMVNFILKPKGKLIINELVEKTFYSTLTFGLLDGWWLADDDHYRVNGSPLLTRKMWEIVLGQCGFGFIEIPIPKNILSGQAIIAASTTGVVYMDTNDNITIKESTVDKTNKIVKANPVRNIEFRDSNQIKKGIANIVANVARVSVDKVKPNTPFSDYGIDSILGVSFIQNINEKFGTDFTTPILFEYTTIKSLSDHIDEIGMHKIKRSDEKDSTGKGEIAVIGMAGQFPGAENIDAFWENLIDEKDVSKIYPKEYLDHENYYRENKQTGKSYCNRGGILEYRDSFDPLFFHISPRDADSMNPHQRLMIQESWKAIENAGMNPLSLVGFKVGVFVGVEPSGYAYETFTGSSDAIIASRLSYFLNLKGPALVVNTACSSSASAIHLACNSILNGESQLALAGGVFAVMDQNTLISLSQVEMLSPSGACFSFDSSADGTAMSEGVGVMLLKSYEKAVKEGDPIYGVIEASAMNQDGTSNGITAPNGSSQVELITELYSNKNIKPQDITYVEAHGTGTKLGDPVEANALIKSFSNFTTKKNYCVLGSVKSHIGHTSAAAGVIGLISVLKSMENRVLPSLKGFKKINPLVKIKNSPFLINSKSEKWEPNGKPLKAAVNSFGHSGTNIHMVVRDHEKPIINTRESVPCWIPISARSIDSLCQIISELVGFIGAGSRVSEVKINDVAYTLQVGRPQWEFRSFVFANSTKDFLVQAESLLEYLSNTTIDLSKINKINDQLYLGTFNGDVEDPELFNKNIYENLNPFCLDIDIIQEWILNYNIDWNAIYNSYNSEGLSKLHLPGYSFQKTKYGKPKQKDVVADQKALSAEKQSLNIIEEKDWLFASEDWHESARDNKVDWKLKLAELGNKEILVLVDSSDIRAKANDFYKAIFQSTNKSPARLQVVVWDQVDSIDWKQKYDVVLVLKVSKPNTANDINKDLERLFDLSTRFMKKFWNEKIQLYYIHNTFEHEFGYRSLSGYFRSSMMENPNHAWKLITDIRSKNGEGLLQNLAQEWISHTISNSGEDYCEVLIGNERKIKKFTEYHLTDNKTRTFKEGGSYIVTGGLGPVGYLLCEKLSKKYNANIFILSRSPLDNEKQKLIDNLNKLGGRAYYYSLNICDRLDFEKVLDKIRGEGSINGVIHLARLVEDGIIAGKSWDSFQRTINAKVTGSKLLDELTKNDALDFFMMFSSMASFGLRGGSDYSYSAAYQNDLARFRNELVKKGERKGFTISQCWGPWTVDKYMPENREDNLKNTGFELVSMDDAFPMIDKCLNFKQPVITMMAVADRPKIEALIGLEIPSNLSSDKILSQWENEEKPMKFSYEEVGNVFKPQDIQSLSDEDVDRLFNLMRQKSEFQLENARVIPLERKPVSLDNNLKVMIREVLKIILKLDDVKDDTSFQRYGLDSISAMQLASSLEKELQIDMEPGWLIDHPTVNKLFELLESKNIPVEIS